MTLHAVVRSAPRDNVDARGAVTVDGNRLPPAIPADNVTAMGTNPNQPQIALPPIASTADESRKFLENVLVWPESDQAPGWINMHVNVKNTTPAKNGGKPWVAGWPFKTVDEVLNRASWVESTADFFNVWVCMSQQSDCLTKADGKRKAVRKAANATALKAIWIDCDVKPGDAKHYHALTEAFDALKAFRQRVGLPPPSMVVNSGGGLHVYWISDTPLSVHEWRPYAEGLKALLLREGIKCDTGLTTDAARILRVPGTLNHKYDPPRRVELLQVGQAYEFAKDLAFLTQVSTAVTATVSKPRLSRDIIVPATEPGGGGTFDAPDPAFSTLNVQDASPQDGCTPQEAHLVDPRPIFGKEGCAFLREALRTGGRDYDNPKWNLSVLCTAFMENGNSIAHKVSKGHGTYTPADTQALYERKLADRERGVGYPSCRAIEGTGCKSCVTCPHFAKGKSPLNIRPVVTATVRTPEQDFADPYEEFVGPPFPLEVLSPKLRKFVDATATALGADRSAVATASLAAISGAMNAETTVRLGDDWWEKPIIWVLLVGLPSSLKSPIIDKTTRPLRRIDQERGKLYKKQYAGWLQDKKKIAVPAAPPRCVINDATPEKVAEILSRAPCGSLMVQDEVAGWIESFERYSSGSSRPFYLQAWNGSTFTKDRVGKGKDDLSAEICIDNLALSILGGIQPDKLTKIGDLTDDGLLQRFLAVLMKSSGLPDTYTSVAAAASDYEQLIRSINAAPAQQFKFEEDACEVRDDMLHRLHDLEKVDGFPAPLIAAIGKLKGYFGRLCLVLQVTKIHDPTEHGDNDTFTPEDAARVQQLFGLEPDNSLSGGVNWSQAIARDTAKQADKLIRQFLLPHLFGFYDGVVNGGRERHKLRDLADFVLSTDKDRLRPSDFTAGVRSLRGEPDHRIKEWAGRLCAMGWLDPEEGKPGTPIKAWHVATGLREYFQQRREQARTARAEAHRILKAGGTYGSGRAL
ncbi:DUF3987 domain-containing protein [Bradyrhizobium sp. 6(2017)]|uniref:DUF3987 domain-containing protein n=1 Tax=Bradyrhizobium sp. 6(2017) TaxID=1197460 RepID=UPI0013E0EF87|nr:DUF3987 domain-containing protein [Bradyrhizobium sp. 6(2017)]QIG96816.1 DUF3987 domain-containing protein [Bradyrhizobium sp. 6(2017)]